MAKRCEDTIVIDNTKIYTSYFDRAIKIVPDRRLVSIAIGSPLTWNGSYYRDLNPSDSLFINYKSNKITKEQYKETYYSETLSRLDPVKVYNELKGKVCCCWEESGYFCHRNLFLEWIESKLGTGIIGGEI